MRLPVNYRIHGSRISATTKSLLDATDINASRLDRRFDLRVAQGACPFIWGLKDDRLKKIRHRTGVPVEMISRDHRNILMKVQWFDPYVIYEEISTKKCHLEIPGEIPESFAVNAKGRKIYEFVEGLGLFGELTIANIINEGSRIIFNVKQTWQTVR